jgi:tetratricopeptide (TPR) repeat protein
MTAPEPNRLRRRVLLFGFVLLALGLALFFTRSKFGRLLHSDEFTRLTNVGKNYLDKGEVEKALAAFQQAVALNPAHPDAQLNLANAYLRASQPEKAIQHAQEVLALDQGSGAAHFLIGCAWLRLGNATEALKSLQTAKDIDRTVNAVSFQLGRAHQQLNHWDEAIAEFQEVVKFETNHPAAYYNLSQVLTRTGQTNEAAVAFAQHQQVNAGRAGQISDPSVYERCVYTQARLPFQLEQPDKRGVEVTFVDGTAAAFGAAATNYHGPVGILDFNHDGRNSLFVGEGASAFRLLENTAGKFQPRGQALTNLPGANYTRCLVGDVNNDHFDDVIMLGDKGAQLFQFATNGVAADRSAFAQLTRFSITNALLTDFNFTGFLDLLAIQSGGRELWLFKNLGHPYFSDKVTNSGLLRALTGGRQVVVDDWNGDDLQDVFIAREGQPPLLLTKIRGGGLTETNSPADWPVGSLIAVGDVNNDLRPDLLVATANGLVVVLNGLKERLTIPWSNWTVTSLVLLDYDNDGWLDIIAAGDGLRVWRNRGNAGFEETTRALGLDRLVAGRVESLAAADFDRDGATDLLVTTGDQKLQLLLNRGANKNKQLKLQLVGTKSNASGLGILVEVNAGGLRLSRRVTSLPIEIGVGKYEQLDTLSLRWFSFNLPISDVKVDPLSLLSLTEIEIKDGSCPYLYAWDGKGFRFVTDLLGAAPVGLPMAEGRYIEADPEEFVSLGNEKLFVPRDRHYVVQVTEELREVLYLDEAKLVVVDHPSNTEVHATSKLRPGRPFPPGALITLERRHPLLQATRHDGLDVTAALLDVDKKLMSPVALRVPQRRGLAEPHSVTLDFGPLPVERPLVLAMTGWLQFGGGMANVSASLDPDLPFPFPTLEVETAGGEWKPVDVVVGAPAGKTKTIVVELAGRLPSGSRRLRLSEAFEIHWDRIALFEQRDAPDTAIHTVAATRTDLHWRGFSALADLPWYLPLTPIYEVVRPAPPWRITPSGWCTRYGAVDELISRRDDALALINGGDELTISFSADQLPLKPAGAERDFFFYSVGWDKDSDFHVARGTTVEPLPWHGMDDQQHGRQERPVFPSDNLMQKYSTRWVGPYTVTRRK